MFRYTAAGQKVAKLVYQAGKPTLRTDYLGPFQYEGDSLRFFPHAEGRVLRFVSYDAARQPSTRYEREFTFKDHLGNLRLAYRLGAVRRDSASLEPDGHGRESQAFDSLSVSAPVAQPVGSALARTGSYAARLNAGGAAPQPLGPLRQLAVQKGDTVTVWAYGSYAQPVQHNFLFTLASFLTSLLHPVPGAPAGPDPTRGRAGLPLLQVGVAAGLSNLPQLSGGVPKGYVRVLVFNADSVLVAQPTLALSSAALGHYERLRLRVVMPTDGYVTAYVGNESDVDVLFDDVVVEHRPGLQVQENQYDPYGLSLVGLDVNPFKSHMPNLYQFNGKERQIDLGLGWNDYGARFYDEKIMVWSAIDPAAVLTYESSPYAFVRGNPTSRLDPNGMWDITVHAYNDRSKHGYGIAVVTDRKGKEIYRFDVRLEGTGGRDRTQKNADTPLGVYDIPDQDMWNRGGPRESYGANPRLILTPKSGEIKKSRRDDIRIHGGRQEVKDEKTGEWKPVSNPELKKTHGCMRCSDGDVKDLKTRTDELQKNDPKEKGGTLTVVDDLQRAGVPMVQPETYTIPAKTPDPSTYSAPNFLPK